MIKELCGKKVVFLDVGYTIDYPASGDWMLTKKFYEIVGNKIDKYSSEEIQRAKEAGLEYLTKNHVLETVDAEYRQFIRFYSDISDYLQLGLTENETIEIAHDRTFNMQNYIAYSDAKEVLEELGKTFILGIISDTWPSIDNQLESIGVRDYFSFYTYSYELGVFKPDKRMFLDAIKKCGFRAEETVFIDDSVSNLEGAAKAGITPVLIAANPASDVVSPYTKIRSLSELL